MSKIPHQRNLAGGILVPRQWFRDTKTLSSKQRELLLLLTTLMDWDPKHPKFGTVDFVYEDLAMFAVPENGWSNTTYGRTISELIQAGEVKRISYGSYRITKALQFLSGKIKQRAASSDSQKIKFPLVGGFLPPMGTEPSPVGYHPPQVGTNQSVPDGERDLKNVKNLKNESTGDFFYDTNAKACPFLGPLTRKPLIEAIASTFPHSKDRALAEAEIVSYHESRLYRELPCSRSACLETVACLLKAVETNALSNPVGYFRKGLKELLEDGTDAAIRGKESRLLARKPNLGETVLAASILLPGGQA